LTSRSEPLAEALRQAVLAQRFDTAPDRQRGGALVAEHPSLDLAVVRFHGAAAPEAANVLFSREHPRGVVARFGGAHGLGAVSNLRFDADFRDATGTSAAWQPGADWRRMPWQPLFTPPALPADAPRFVAPYPASLLKLMVAVGLALAVDAGKLGWPEVLPQLTPMMVVSDNDATDRCVALLHRVAGVESLNSTMQKAWGLPTLQLNRTTPAGGWRNGDGAGVGAIHMTAWDTVRLLWLIDPAAPAAPWLAPGAPRLSARAQAELMAVLRGQQLDEILSSGALRGLPGWLPGLPDAPTFAHKTGNTENYSADAGSVRIDGGVHYLVAVLSNLGSRYRPVFVGADDDRAATTWRLPALGAALHALMMSAPK
jgi:hypothetical protein